MSPREPVEVEPYATMPVIGSRPLSLLALRSMTYEELREEWRKWLNQYLPTKY